MTVLFDTTPSAAKIFSSPRRFGRWLPAIVGAIALGLGGCAVEPAVGVGAYDYYGYPYGYSGYYGPAYYGYYGPSFFGYYGGGYYGRGYYGRGYYGHGYGYGGYHGGVGPFLRPPAGGFRAPAPGFGGGGRFGGDPRVGGFGGGGAFRGGLGGRRGGRH